MKTYKFRGKSESEALLKASEELGLDIKDMDYEVREEQKGLFGLLKEYEVIVKVPDDFEPGQSLQEVITPMEEVANQAAQLTREILELMGYEADVHVSTLEGQVQVDIETPNEEELAGEGGKVLSALQFVVNRAINKDREDKVRVLVDAGGVREKHEEFLRKEALALAEKAIREHRVIRMGPMSAKDRRVIHLALRDHKGVTTRSEGEGIKRRLLIIPKEPRRGGRKRGRRGERTARSSRKER